MNAEEHLEKARINRARFTQEEKRKDLTTAIVLVAAATISLAFLIFAFHAKQRAAQLEEELSILQNELAKCQAGK